MPVKTDTRTRFADELHVISPWTYLFVVLGFLVLIAAMAFVVLSGKDHPSPAVMIFTAIVGGTAIACYILLIGYVNGDAGRRGMSRLLWTLIAIFVPNALGIVLYFVLRKPRLLHCPQCDTVVDPAFGFCPRCRHKLGALCPQCGHGVNPTDKFCPYCGADLATVPTPVPTT